MNIAPGIPDFNAPVADHARKDFPLLDAGMIVGEALERIRREGVGERVVYFYAVDEQKRLVGVVPTRRLLSARLETPLRQIMVPRVVAIPTTATVLDANLFAEEILEAGESEDRYRSTTPVGPEFFEALGFRIEQIRGVSPWRVFRFRFPWLLVTVTCGTLSAILARFFEVTLARSLVLAFFLSLVLALNESVSMQSMSVTIHALRSVSVTRRWLAASFRREVSTALLLGLACGIVVSAIVWLWRNDFGGAFVIGGSIALSLVTASALGLGVPSFLHRFKLDLKIAAGPVNRELADLVARLVDFTCAWL